MLLGIFERIADDVFRSGDGNGLDGYARIGADCACAFLRAEIDELGSFLAALFELDAGVEVLGILANDNQIHILVPSTGAGDGDNGA